MTAKREGMLTSLARKVGTTAGVIVAKTTHLKDEVAKIGKPTSGPPSMEAQKVDPPEQEVGKKKARRKRPAPKKQATRTIANREKRAKKPARRVLKDKGSNTKKVRGKA